MTENRMNEIKEEAEKISSAIIDLQTVVAHHSCIDSKEIREIIFYRLKDIRNQVDTFKRDGRRDQLDQSVAVRLKLTNSFNSLRDSLQREHLRNGLDNVSDSEMMVLACMCDTISSNIRLLLAMRDKENRRLDPVREVA